MDYLTLRRHIGELAQSLCDRPLIARAFDAPGRAVSLRLKTSQGWADLVISLDNPNQGIRLTEACAEIERASSMTRTLNRLITNGRILSMALAGDEGKGQFDRVVRLHIAVIDSFFGNRSDFYIFGEFTGRIADVFICDSEHKILDRMSRTSNNLIGETYRLPDSPPLLNPFDAGDEQLHAALSSSPERWPEIIGAMSPQLREEVTARCIDSNNYTDCFKSVLAEFNQSQTCFAYLDQHDNRLRALAPFRLESRQNCREKQFATVNQAMNWVEDSLVAGKRLNEIKKRALINLQKDLRLKNDLLNDQKKLRLKYENFASWQTMGNLIVANLYQIKPGSRSVTLEDWESQTEITIELDPAKTPAAVAQKYFNLTRKYRRGIEEVDRRVTVLNSEIMWLREQIWLCESATSEADILIGEKNSPERSDKKNRKEPEGRRRRPDVKPVLEVDGCRFYVGRNARQNDILTFQLARKGDFWFHANDVPGAHVILKKPEGTITEEDLHRGALMAAWFSFARESSKVPVDVTEAANVKRIPGGGPGRVSYTGQKTLFVNPAAAAELLAEKMTDPSEEDIPQNEN